MAVLLAAGVGLVLFGALILLRFPDRPGGRIAWQGLEVSSVGAGLPLVVIGVAAIGVGATRSEDGAPAAPGSATPAGIVASDSHPCPDLFAGIPRRRVASLEEGVNARIVVRPSEPKAGPIGLSLTDGGRPIGALRIVYFPDDGLFKVDGVVDARCRPVTSYENLSRGSDPDTLQNFDTLGLVLGGRRYALHAGGSTDVRFDFLQAAA